MKAIIIGNGLIAATHIQAIRSIGSEISCIVGRDEARTAAFAKEHGITHWTTDLSEALSADADIVHICTPPYNHGELIRACLKAGKHIICEKPLCIDPDEAAELASLARQAREEKGIVTALCCNVRYYPANLEATKRIRASYKGGPLVMHGSYLQEFHIPPHPDGWRFDADLSEGMRAISEIGTHWIDLAHAWTGARITEVFADLRNWYPNRRKKDGMIIDGDSGSPLGHSAEDGGSPLNLTTEDSAAILLRFEGGGIGALLLSETAPGHPNDLTIEFTDMKTSYRWEESDPAKLYISSDGAMHPYDAPVNDRDETFASLFGSVYAAAERIHNRPDAHSGAASEGRNDAALRDKTEAVFPTFDDGLYISKVCAAIKKSGHAQSWTST